MLVPLNHGQSRRSNVHLQPIDRHLDVQHEHLRCLFDFGWFAQDLLVWTPDILGSILFQISGSLALIEICKRWWCWNIRQLTWWIGAINFAGCVAFLVSAILAFTPPAPTNALIINWATTFTLIGAICFFAGAFLIWSTLDRKSD